MAIVFQNGGRRRKGGASAPSISAKDAIDVSLTAYCRERRLSLTREHPFMPGRKFSFDWAIVELKIGIEFEGGMFGKPGARRCPVCKELPKVSHFAIDRIKRDAEKYNLAAAAGWAVIRLIPTMVKKNGDASVAIGYVENTVEKRVLTGKG